MNKKKTWLYPTFWSIVIAGIFPILASEILKNSQPFLQLTGTFFFASIVLWILLLIKGKLHELKNPSAWKYGLLTWVLNWALFYGFYYLGLKFTTPWNAALISQSEVIFSFLFFQSWKKEAFSKEHIFWSLLLVFWALYIILPKTDGINIWDILVLLAMVFAPLWNYFQKKWRTYVSVYSFLFMRYITTIPFVILWSFLLGEYKHFELNGLVISQMILMWILVFTIKNILWVEAIKMVTVTRILALHGFAPFLTLVILWIFFHTPPTTTQFIVGLPMFFGVLLLTKK